ncbi:catalase [Pseudidiomarina sp.]|uniref:catalase n=1 Tax=Pseudidiomarina sp. TaxID=2081707 RepID=UPI003A97CE13
MKYRLTALLSVMTALTSTSVLAFQQDENRYAVPASATAQDFIAVFKELNGEHPGVRKGHARGVCAAGIFTPTDEAQKRFASPLFDNVSLPVTIRFSMGGGNPEADERKGPRGIGIQFDLANNQKHTLAGLTSPLFSGSTPNHFLGLLQWNVKLMRGEATREDLEKYFQANPSMLRSIEWNKGRTPSAEYTSTDYYGIHAFWANTHDQQREKFRWQLVPDGGHEYLTEHDIESLPSSFLVERLEKRLEEEGQISFAWEWTIGQENDPTNDPSILWPNDREKVNVGRVTITQVGGDACTPINFDPNRVAPGIQPSDDPVLPIRSAAYAISFGKRLSNQ